MKMSVTNTKQRRISFAMFLGFFLLAVIISCMAFMNSVKLKEVVPTQELAPLKEKEQVLANFAKLSQALCKYDDAQRSNIVSINQNAAECRKLSEDLHLELKQKDTARIYNDMVSFMRMADQYLFSIREKGAAASAQQKVSDGEIARLRATINDLQAKYTSLQTKEGILQSTNANLQNQVNQLQLLAAQKSKDEGSSGGGAPANCIEEMNKLNDYKTKVLTVIGAAKLNVQHIQSETESITHVIGVANNKRKKENISKSIIQLGQELEKLQ